MHALFCPVRDYDWGSTTLLAGLEGREPTGAPEAEKWMGDHPGAPAEAALEDGTRVSLAELIAADPERLLGAAAGMAPGGGDRLPFLLKLLAAGRPLSIQAHPTLEQATAGYAREEAAGVPRTAGHRNYKDANHKPEMVLALTPFTALCGFRRTEESAAAFENLSQMMREHADGDTSEASAAAGRVAQLLHHGDLEEAFTALLDPASVWSRGGVEDAIAAVQAMGDVEVQDSALTTAVQIAQHCPGDPGVMVSLLLNRVDLMPGQAVHLPAGNVHAYLHGLGVEVMASSDNVLRGGLTTKHVDVPELRSVVRFEPLPVPYTSPERVAEGRLDFTPPFDEFALTQLSVDAEAPSAEARLSGPAIAVCTRGPARLRVGGQTLELTAGQSVFVGADETAAHPIDLSALDEEATVHIAWTPAP